MNKFVAGILIGCAASAAFSHFSKTSAVQIEEPLPDWVVREHGREAVFKGFNTSTSISIQPVNPDDLRTVGARIQVEIAAPDGSHPHANLSALIDTGADQTYVRESVLKELGIAPTMEGTVFKGVTGEEHASAAYKVQMKLQNGSTVPMYVLATNPKFEDVLIGRDLLSKMNVIYNGPSSHVLLSWGGGYWKVIIGNSQPQASPFNCNPASAIKPT